MQGYELIIDSKPKTKPFTIVSPDDFTVHQGQTVDPHIVLQQPNISFYCLDHANRRAIFTETAPDVDLLREPFYFIAQYEAAQRLIAVPYETLHALAQQVTIDPQKIILFFSTGRCGSTLLSHVLNLDSSIISFSEPDVFSQLVQLHTAKQCNDEEATTLLRDATLIMSANAQLQGFEFFAFKFRSYVLSLSNLLHRALPTAKTIFLYRNALSWARSFSRAFGAPTDAALQENLIQDGFRYMIPSVNVYLETHEQPISWIEYIARMWVSTMQDARWLKAQGAPLAYGRFEDLKTSPETVIEHILTQCGLSLPNPDQLAQVLAKDSQEGTAGAQDKQKPARHLTDADLTELESIIHQLDATLTPDSFL